MFKGRPPFSPKELSNMRKLLYASVALILFSAALTGCNEELKSVHGMVKGVKIEKDTLKAMSISINEKGDTLLFSLDDARLQNGIMMPQDSVIVDYISGRKDTLRALVVTVLPSIKSLEPQQVDTLITSPHK